MPQKILVVDDEQDVLDVLERFLLAVGYEPVCFVDGQKAIAAMKDHAFDLALVDLKLPKKSGIEIMKALHALDSDLPVIILTGYGTVESAVEAMELGAFNFLTKPYKQDELLFQVRQGLSKKLLLGEIRELKEKAGQLSVSDLMIVETASGSRVRPFLEAVDEFKAQYMIYLIEVSKGDLRKAAEASGLSIDEFFAFFEKYAIDYREFQA